MGILPSGAAEILEILVTRIPRIQKQNPNKHNNNSKEFQESRVGSCALATTSEEFQESQVEQKPHVSACAGALAGILEIHRILPGEKV